ncbi:cation transport protein-domain-containing protein [Pisolithus microcarpus]|nr:cation transport protein-domain-containing protein [Pisolithus microcarpus]
MAHGGRRFTANLWQGIRENLNFFRVHLLFFTFTPLVASAVLYASNGKYPISYVDALFNSVSAMTVCGLSTVNLSSLTPWQQVILFLQMCFGSPVLVSWSMVFMRRYFFSKKFDHIIAMEAARHAKQRLEAQLTRETSASRGRGPSWSRRISTLFRRRPGLSPLPESELSAMEDALVSKGKEGDKTVRARMIRRMDAPPRLVNPSGRITETGDTPDREYPGCPNGNHMVSSSTTSSPGRASIAGERASAPESGDTESIGEYRAEGVRLEVPERTQEKEASAHSSASSDRPSSRRLSDPRVTDRIELASSSHPLAKSNTFHTSSEKPERSPRMSKGINVEFSPTVGHQDSAYSTAPDTTWGDGTRQRRPTVVSTGVHVPLARNPTIHTYRSVHTVPRSDGCLEVPPSQSVYKGFGGFPMPHQIIGRFLGRLFPKAKVRLHRTMTIPVTTSLTGGSVLSHGRRGSHVAPDRGVSDVDASKPATYISFRATVGRNSAFRALTNEQLEELGGVEYRALNALLWLVAMYHFGIQIISFVVIAPYMSISKWSSDFEPPALQRSVAPYWFSLFQVISAYTNTGMSLVDQSMVPFQTAYPMIFLMIICILAGNTAFVSRTLRFTIWIVTKTIPAGSRLNETLHFLLDHPRRCFIYLFPSHQTWFLVTMLLVLNVSDWLCFLILDIGNSAISSIPIGARIVAGFYQAIAVRNAGFGIVPLSQLAPAVKVMYVIMMYISVCDVRSTNVYEEQSLGIFSSDKDDEENFHPIGSRVAIWGRYLGMHARRQLSFDMWWLSLGLFLVCIIERDNLDNPDNQSWFNIFTIIFELVSAYGSVGLSMGVPNQNYSFSGSLRPLSKLVITLVMLRGRHRGLPVAIDRAVMLPSEFKNAEENSDPQPTVDKKRSSHHSSNQASRLFNGPGEVVDLPENEEGIGEKTSETRTEVTSQ